MKERIKKAAKSPLAVMEGFARTALGIEHKHFESRMAICEKCEFNEPETGDLSFMEKLAGDRMCGDCLCNLNWKCNSSEKCDKWEK